MTREQVLRDAQLLSHSDQAWLLNELADRKFERCDECGALSCDCESDCDAYKDYKETLCPKCVMYCNICELNYGSSGNYKHEECRSQEQKVKRRKRKREQYGNSDAETGEDFKSDPSSDSDDNTSGDDHRTLDSWLTKNSTAK